MIQITKALAVVEDVLFGQGTVVQQRDLGNGLEPVTYNMVEAKHIPTDETDVQADLTARYTKAEIDASFALISTILTKTQIVPYTPTAIYHPATKKYVDETVTAIGAGDMDKATYDNNTNGTVDDAEAVGGISPTILHASRGITTDLSAITEPGIYSGENVPDSPISGPIIVNYVRDLTNEITTVYSYTGSIYYKKNTGPWKIVLTDDKVVNDLLDDGTDPAKVLGAYQGVILKDYADSIVISGSNSHGSWTKFSDGTLICRLSQDILRTTDTADGALFRTSSSVGLEFPVHFIDVPQVSAVSISSTISTWAIVASVFPTTLTLLLMGSTASSSGYLGYMAIGKWK